MESRSRSVRPYLIQSNEVDKFLRKQRLPSPYRRPFAYTLEKFPKNDSEENKYAATNTHLPAQLSTRITNIGANGTINSANGYSESIYAQSSFPNKFLENRKRVSGRSPSVPPRNGSSSYTARTNGYGETPTNDQLRKGGFYEQQQRNGGRVIPVHTKADEKHLGFSNPTHKREYSVEPIGGKRFSSTLNVNGSLPSSSSSAPLGHRRSNSITSSAFSQRQSSSYRNGNTPDHSSRTLQHGLQSSQFYDDGEFQKPVPIAEPEEPPQFDELMERFSNISTSDTRPRLPSASMYQIPSKTISTPTKFTSSTLPPTAPSAFSRTQQNSLISLQPRAVNTNVQTFFNEKPIVKEKKLNQQISSSIIPCLKGLTNHGNTCYFSAIIQCLSCCEHFAKYFVCNESEETIKRDGSSADPSSASHKPLLSNALSATLRCLWFNNSLADSSCYQLLQLISKANPQFVFSQQQDAHECLIWLLNRLHDEIKEREIRANNNRIDKANANVGTMIIHQTHKSEGELASDALERVSGANRSTVMDLFRAQFRSAVECTNPVCAFTNLTFDPYLSISLSVPLPKKPSEVTVLFVPFFGARQIIRYHFQLADPLYTIWDVKERVMQHVRAPSEQAFCCQFEPNGQCHFLSDDVKLDENIKEITLVEVPKLNEQQQMQEMVVAIVVFVLGIVPDGEKYGNPFVVVLNRHWSYDRISTLLFEKGAFQLPRAYYPLSADYTLLIQHSAEQVACLDPAMAMPLFHDYINKTLANEQSTVSALKLIVEWSSSVRHEFQRVSMESVAHDYTFCRGRFQNVTYATNGQDEIPTPLGTLIDDYVKRESIQDWKCPKCGHSPGRKELKFHSLPDVLIFHLKRFELLDDGIASKIESRVQVPLEGLDMGPYVFNPDVRANTLPKHRRERVSEYLHQHQEDAIYDLIGIVSHFGQRTNSGHYTATTRNPFDGQWRNFDDSRVSQPIGVGDIRISTKSYLLFYERRSHQRKDDQPYLTTPPCSKWFPSLLPDHVLAKYNNGVIPTAVNSCNGNASLARKSITRLSSTEPFALENGGENRHYYTDDSESEERGKRMKARINGASAVPRTKPVVPIRSSSVIPISTTSADYHRNYPTYSTTINGNNGSAFVRPSTTTLYTPSAGRMALSSHSALASYPRAFTSGGTRLTNGNYPRYSKSYHF